MVLYLLAVCLWAFEAKASEKDLADWGRVLFSDKRLSSTGKVSCETCHQFDRKLTDGKRIGTDIEGKPLHRNSPTLFNVVHFSPLTLANPFLLTLEQQILVPLFLDTPGEMGLSKVWPEVKTKLRTSSDHKILFEKSFPREEIVEISHVVKALAAFVRTFEQPKTDYDRFLEGATNALL